LHSRSRSIQSTATNPPGLHHCLAYRCVRTPVKAQLLPVALASAHMKNPHYSITVAEVLDSPLGYLALMAVPIGLYFMFKILLWDYTVSQPSWLSKHASLLSTLSQVRQSLSSDHPDHYTHLRHIRKEHIYIQPHSMLAVCNSCMACRLLTALPSRRE